MIGGANCRTSPRADDDLHPIRVITGHCVLEMVEVCSQEEANLRARIRLAVVFERRSQRTRPALSPSRRSCWVTHSF